MRGCSTAVLEKSSGYKNSKISDMSKFKIYKDLLSSSVKKRVTTGTVLELKTGLTSILSTRKDFVSKVFIEENRINFQFK